MSESKTFSNDHEFAAEQGRAGGKTQPDEVYKRTLSLRLCATSLPEADLGRKPLLPFPDPLSPLNSLGARRSP